MRTVAISNVRFTEGTEADARSGLLGFITCVVNGTLRLDGITLRRTASGRPTLSFPARRDASGRRRFFIRPLSNRARLEIEEQVLHAIGVIGPRPRRSEVK